MLEIKTATLKKIKKVNIDGHVFDVRKLGAGEQLTLSQYMRELKVLEAKQNRKEELTDGDEANALKYSTGMLNILSSCFDDGGDGSKAKALIDSLAPEELQAVLTEIFKEDETNTDTPQATS